MLCSEKSGRDDASLLELILKVKELFKNTLIPC